jgi:hypothetical protein
MIQLYRCHWLCEIQRNNILCALNSMQERSLYMGVTELPLIKDSDYELDLYLPIEYSTPTSNKSSPSTKRKLKKNSSYFHSNDLSNNSTKNLLNQFSNNIKMMSSDNKHDTRVVNEAFQVRTLFVYLKHVK